MKLPASLASGLEAAINRYLSLDPDVRPRLARLEGRIIALDLRGLDLKIFLRINGDGITILNASEQAPDTVLHGSPLGMARLGLGSSKTGALFSGEVEIEGDIDTGQDFKALLDKLDIDWEEQLSRLTGDVIAHQAGNAARKTGNWLRHVRTTLEQDLSEYLQEELRVVPTRIEIENFVADVDRLGMDVGRIEARTNRLLSAGEGK